MSRIVLCLPLLMVDAMNVPYWTLYVRVGTTEMEEGDKNIDVRDMV